MSALPRVDHIGIIVPDLETAMEFFNRLLGLAPATVKEMNEVGLKIAEFKLANLSLELLQYTGSGSGLAERTMGDRPGYNHISLAVNDLGSSLEQLKSAKVEVQDGFPRQGAHGLVAFLKPHTTNNLLLEICQPHHDQQTHPK